MNNKIIVCLFILNAGILFQNKIYAQEIFSLQQCVEYSLQNNENLKNYKVDQEIAVGNTLQSKSKYYPQLTGIADIRDNLKLQTSILPFNPDASPTAVQGPTAVQFGTQYNATAALEANWTVYDPALRTTIQSQKINQDIAKNNSDGKTLDIAIEIKKAYYSTLLNREKIKFYTEGVKRTQKFYEDAKILAESKQLQNIEVSKAYLDFQNQKVALEKAGQDYQKSQLLLKYNMGYPLENSLILGDSTLLENINPNMAMDTDDFQVENRYEYKNLLLENQQESLNIKKTQKGYIPTVSLYGYGGTQAFRNQFDIFNFNGRWFPLAYIGVRASIPIFDGFLKKHQVSNSKLELIKKENEKILFVKKFNYDRKNSEINILNSIRNLEVQKNNLQLANEILKVTIDRYQSGLILSKEVTDAEFKLSEAQTNYLSGLYDYVVSRLEFEKIKGK